MGRRWLVAVLFVVLLVAPSVTAAEWHQYRANAERNAVLDPLPSVVDVVRKGLLQGEHVDHGGVNQAPVLLQTDEGWVWSERSGPDRCQIVQRTDLFDNTMDRTTPIADCNGGLLQAYDPVTQRTLICSWVQGDGPVLRAIDLDGRTAWAVTPNGTLSLPMLRTDGGDELFYRCENTALDLEARILYVVVNANCPGGGATLADQRVSASDCTGLHRLAAIDLDHGLLRWNTEVQDELAQEGLFRVGDLGHPIPNEGSGTLVLGTTIVGEHLYVTFRKTCRTCSLDTQTGGAWFDRASGQQIGIVDQDEGEVEDVNVPPNVDVAHSRLAVAREGIAYTYHRGAVSIVDPTTSQPLSRIDLGENEAEQTVTEKATPVWWNQRVVVPGHSKLYGIDSESHEVVWEWSAGRNRFIEHVVATADGEIVALLVDLAQGGVRLVRLAAISGVVIQEIPVALDLVFERSSTVLGGTRSWKVDLAPGPDGGVLILDQHGGYAHITSAPADDALHLRLSTAYPATGDPVTLDLTGPATARPNATAVEMAWGDGMHRVYDPDEPLSHRYAENGDHDIRITVVYGDGLTRSAKATVHVGEPAPPELSALQRVFAPENADVTWGVLGVLIAVFGGLMAFARGRLRKNRLEYKLAELERLKARAVHDVPGAIRDVDAYRSALRADLRRGKLDDIQYAVLEGEIQRSLRLWYHRLLAPYESRMSDRFRRHLTGSLEDGTLHAPEADRLVAELARENRLKAGEKAHLKAFFEEWSHGGGS